ncbi:MAG: ADP-ribose-binding protein [Thermoprotei archaeon]
MTVLVEFECGGIRLKLVKGDITELESDVVVNAANSWLKHGGGVALAIVRKGGRVIQEESDAYVAKYGPVPVGGVAVTTAGSLKAKFVVHAVGPVYGERDHEAKLASAFRNSLMKTDELGAHTVALPAISTGVYGYPLDKCATILSAVLKQCCTNLKSVNVITVCLYDQESYESFKQVFQKQFK